MTDIVDTGALRELLEKATPQNLDTAEESGGGTYDCPLCDGTGCVEGSEYTNYDDVPLGVQFFGVGDAHRHAEALFRAVMPALPALLDEVERLREALFAVGVALLKHPEAAKAVDESMRAALGRSKP